MRTVELSGPIASTGRLGGVAAAPDGSLFVTSFASSVWRITFPDGPEGVAEVERVATDFALASGNAVDASGRLYQSDFQRNQIRALDPDGWSVIADSGLNGPVGLAVGPEGELYVTNFDNDRIVRVDPEGHAEVWAVVGPGSGNAQLARVGDALYVTKIGTNELFLVRGPDDVALVAGTGETGLDDGPGLEATLARPNGIATVGSVLYMNNLDGVWRSGKPCELVMRRVVIE